MEMQMTFYWGYDATILFPWWETSTALEFYLSCLCIFALCLGSAKLKAVCRDLQRGGAHVEEPARPVVREVCSEGSVATASGSSSEMNGLPSVMTAASDRWPAAPPLLQPGGTRRGEQLLFEGEAFGSLFFRRKLHFNRSSAYTDS
ncbi:hypothetical protein, conserved [Eimeria acervulina]|uniref:Copper transport protein n=1 Tax=Eimeria acervulina TaxID=5801 RepID=U6GDN1_EIMAC|nr:hypothetical protein, conserved [Eimeria acervulina]CDI77448.1 hypothetical protein, conserved [Eimeria acervulina]